LLIRYEWSVWSLGNFLRSLLYEDILLSILCDVCEMMLLYVILSRHYKFYEFLNKTDKRILSLNEKVFLLQEFDLGFYFGKSGLDYIYINKPAVSIYFCYWLHGLINFAFYHLQTSFKGKWDAFQPYTYCGTYLLIILLIIHNPEEKIWWGCKAKGQELSNIHTIEKQYISRFKVFKNLSGKCSVAPSAPILHQSPQCATAQTLK